MAIPSLDVLINNNSNICAVYCQPPRPAGRGKTLRKSPGADSEQNLQTSIYGCLFHLRMPSHKNYFQSLKADVCIVVAYGLILPNSILYAPRFGCINAHASLLPRWRGAAPIQRAIISGDQENWR